MLITMYHKSNTALRKCSLCARVYMKCKKNKKKRVNTYNVFIKSHVKMNIISLVETNKIGMLYCIILYSDTECCIAIFREDVNYIL